MDVSDLVRRHYGRGNLEETVLAELAGAGVDTARLTVADLAAVDQLHAGFLPATHHLLDQLALSPQLRLLDVGSGIGGPARAAAAAYGCSVVGIDLSPDFVRAAQALTERVQLTGLVEFRVSAGERLDLADASFDRAMMVHVGMNIEDKAAVFAEVRRVLRPEGLFAVYDQMQTGVGQPTYPLPWAEDERSSFLTTPDAYADHLETAGFTVVGTDRTPMTAPPPGPPRLGPAAVFGPGFAERMGNNLAATAAGHVSPVLILARAH